MASRVFIRRIIGASLLAAALAGCKLASYFTQDLIAEAANLAVFALSLDFLAPCGLVSFGHSGLLGVGAYAFGGRPVPAGFLPGPAPGRGASEDRGENITMEFRGNRVSYRPGTDDHRSSSSEYGEEFYRVLQG